MKTPMMPSLVFPTVMYWPIGSESPKSSVRQGGSQDRHLALALDLRVVEVAPLGQRHIAHRGEAGGGAEELDIFQR